VKDWAKRTVKRIGGFFLNPVINRIVCRTAQCVDQRLGVRLEQRLAAIEGDLRTAKQIAVLKELHPDILKGMRLPPERFTRDMLLDLQYGLYPYRTEAAAVIDAFALETAESLSYFSANLEIREKLGIFRDALDMAVNAKPEILARMVQFASGMTFTGEVDGFYDLCREFLESPFAWSRPEGYSFSASAICVNTFLMAGQMDLAKEALEKSIRHFRGESLEYYLPAAEFAKNNGFVNHAIENSARLLGYFRESARDGTLHKALAGKRVAVVGNGPHEIGRGKGAEIDAHDLVMRFNEFKCGDPYAADYGSKTDIWFMHHPPTMRNDDYFPDFASIRYVATQCNPLHDRYPSWFSREHVVELLDCLDAGKRLLCLSADELSQAVSRRRTKDGELFFPFSSGFLGCEMVKMANPDFSAEDVYGFSFKDSAMFGKDENPHYYQSTHCQTLQDMRDAYRRRQGRDVWQREWMLLRRMFGLEER